MPSVARRRRPPRKVIPARDQEPVRGDADDADDADDVAAEADDEEHASLPDEDDAPGSEPEDEDDDDEEGESEGVEEDEDQDEEADEDEDEDEEEEEEEEEEEDGASRPQPQRSAVHRSQRHTNQSSSHKHNHQHGQQTQPHSQLPSQPHQRSSHGSGGSHKRGSQRKRSRPKKAMNSAVDPHVPLFVLNPESAAGEWRELARELDAAAPVLPAPPRGVIPKPAFRVLAAEPLPQPQPQLNDASAPVCALPAVPAEFVRPRWYVRHVETRGDDGDGAFEYDLDSEDEQWLAEHNKQRRREGRALLSPDLLEMAIDRLEKLAAREGTFAHADVELDDTTVVCAVCDDGYSDDTNLLVYCDGCGLAVHQDCYGILFVPDARWFCRCCEARLPRQSVRCELCPNTFGAFKRTVEGKWAHVVCALWIKELSFESSDSMERIVGVPQVPAARQRLLCYVCQQRGGACVQCSDRSCFRAFHVTCAQTARPPLCLEVVDRDSASCEYRAYCDLHVPPYAAARVAPVRTYAVVRRPRVVAFGDGLPDPARGLTARLAKVVRAPEDLLAPLVTYWLDKRQRGSRPPLLRRLLVQGQENARRSTPQPITWHNFQAVRRDYKKLRQLRAHLERLRNLLELVNRRERLKRDYVQCARQAALAVVNAGPDAPAVAQLHVLAALQREDPARQFEEPVRDEDAPGYTTLIRQPMCLALVRERILANQYAHDPAAFWADVHLTFQNALQYYPPKHPLHRLAARLLELAQRLEKAPASAAARRQAPAPGTAALAAAPTRRRVRARSRPSSTKQRKAPPASVAPVDDEAAEVNITDVSAPASPRAPAEEEPVDDSEDGSVDIDGPAEPPLRVSSANGHSRARPPRDEEEPADQEEESGASEDEEDQDSSDDSEAEVREDEDEGAVAEPRRAPARPHASARRPPPNRKRPAAAAAPAPKRVRRPPPRAAVLPRKKGAAPRSSAAGYNFRKAP